MDESIANLSLAQIASTLSIKEQEVLLASIQIAAKYIQQLQADNNHHQQANTNNNNTSNSNNNLSINLNLDDNSHHLQADDSTHPLHTQADDSTHLTHASELDLDFEIDENDLDEEDDECDSDGNPIGGLRHKPIVQPNQQRTSYKHDASTTDLSLAAENETILIKSFSEELKDRRKRIRLSQKGAAQSLRAFTNGAQPCTDAIIYHYENLQLEPERAMQLIPLLRNWLDWAEDLRNSGKQLPMMSAVTKLPRERKRKVVLFTDKAKEHLEDAFEKNNHPDRYQLDVISAELQIPTRSIRKWFTNRRQRKRFSEKY